MNKVEGAVTKTLQLEEVSQTPLLVWSGSAEEFFARNVGVLTAEEKAAIEALAIGEALESGGGGEPRWRITRVAPARRPR